MAWLNNLGFRWKLTLPIALLALLLMTTALIGVQLSNRLGEDVTRLADEFLPELDNLLQADRDLYQALVAERSMIFVDTNSDGYKKLTALHDENIGQARERIMKFFQTTRSESARGREQELLTLFNKWSDTTQEIEHQRSEGGRIGRSTAIELSFNEGVTQFETMRQVIDELTGQVQADAAADPERGGHQPDRSGDPVGRELVPDNPETEGEDSAADALEDAARDDGGNAVSEGRDRGAGGEDEEGDDEQPAFAEHVSESPEDRCEDGGRDQVAGQDPGDAGRVSVELLHEFGQGRDQGGLREGKRERGKTQDHQAAHRVGTGRLFPDGRFTKRTHWSG